MNFSPRISDDLLFDGFALDFVRRERLLAFVLREDFAQAIVLERRASARLPATEAADFADGWCFRRIERRDRLREPGVFLDQQPELPLRQRVLPFTAADEQTEERARARADAEEKNMRVGKLETGQQEWQSTACFLQGISRRLGVEKKSLRRLRAVADKLKALPHLDEAERLLLRARPAGDAGRAVEVATRASSSW